MMNSTPWVYIEAYDISVLVYYTTQKWWDNSSEMIRRPGDGDLVTYPISFMHSRFVYPVSVDIYILDIDIESMSITCHVLLQLEEL